MIKFYNTKMLSPGESSGNSDMPGKGTYAYDKTGIEFAKSLLPVEPSDGFVTQATENVITYFESDHPVEKENPHGTTIYNHDYKLEVESSETALVRESKELLDAEIRAGVAQSIEPSEASDDPVVVPTTDPVTPVPGQQS